MLDKSQALARLKAGKVVYIRSKWFGLDVVITNFIRCNHRDSYSFQKPTGYIYTHYDYNDMTFDQVVNTLDSDKSLVNLEFSENFWSVNNG